MKTRIAVVGTGGVGGFLGGLLARFYEHSDEAEIYFVSRGQALRNIRERGLLVDAQEGRFTARPKAATDSPAEIGEMDYVLYCTKSYDVEGAVGQLLPCIGPHTVVLPFMNGVDGAERIRRMLPATEVWDGCVYVVAYIVSPGHIAEHTNGYRYLFGSATGDPARLAELERIFERRASGPGSKRTSCAAYGISSLSYLRWLPPLPIRTRHTAACSAILPTGPIWIRCSPSFRPLRPPRGSRCPRTLPER